MDVELSVLPMPLMPPIAMAAEVEPGVGVAVMLLSMGVLLITAIRLVIRSVTEAVEVDCMSIVLEKDSAGDGGVWGMGGWGWVSLSKNCSMEICDIASVPMHDYRVCLVKTISLHNYSAGAQKLTGE